MYGIKLTDTEIATRMVELRNLRKLHAAARKREIAKDAQIAELKMVVSSQQATIDTLLIQVAELQAMVFGKKKKPPTGTSVPVLESLVAKAPRSKDSYHRPIPPATAITSEVAVPLPDFCACGGSFDQSESTTHERYEEDIPLPEVTPNYQPKLVTKFSVVRGQCTECNKITSGRDLGGAQVSLGSNVRLLVTHLTTVGGMSYQQVAGILLALYDLSVSDGEIANILRRQHQAWMPAYNQLTADIRAAPVRHYDETPWKIQAADNAGYAWAMCDADSPKTVFRLATSRGGRHAVALHGDSTTNNSEVVHITDDYSVYRNLPGQQQLCWAHLYRCIRDLRYNDNLPEDQLLYVTWWYEQFAGVYQDLRQYLEAPYDEVVRMNQANELWRRLTALLSPEPNEPKKLMKLKAQLKRAGQDKLFTCLLKDTPCDNNRAERDLRQLVLKRKRSFGSKTERGAQALATVLSLCTTTWRSNQDRSNPTGYFQQLALLG